MAWKLLKTDYVDAVFEGLRRYLMSENGDGSVSFHDITNYTVREGSFFGAKDANAINTAVNAILAALENGTDLYEVFTQFFELQKTLFLKDSDAKQDGFEAYIADLRAYMDGKWDELKAEYTGDIQYFKDVQENAFNVWFQMVRDQLTNDVAGHLQEQIGNLQELKTAKKDSLVNAVNEVKDSAGVTGVKGNAESAYRKGNVNITPEDIGAVNKAGDTMTGSLSSSKTSGTYLEGNQGQAIINSTAEAGAYTMLDKLNSKNGCFTDGVYQGKRQFHYTARSTVAAGKNEVTKSLTILDENGDSDFPGKVNALSFGGNGNSIRVQFNPSADRHLPANNDILYNQLSYIYANLRDLGAVAFSSDYGEIRNKPIGSKIHLAYYEATYGPEDFSLYFNIKNAMLLYGVGGPSSAATPKGKVDFIRVHLLLFDKDYDDNGMYKAKAIQLGSSGQTARWALNPSGLFHNTDDRGKGFMDIRIPKGSWANMTGLEIPLYTQYVND